MKHIWLFSLAFFALLLFVPQKAFAHVGGGPPFVKVNGQYCPNDNYFQGSSTMNIPQDLAPGVYLPNQPIQFEVDLNRLVGQLSITSDFVNSLAFRWSFYQGDNLNERFGQDSPGETTTSYT